MEWHVDASGMAYEGNISLEPRKLGFHMSINMADFTNILHAFYANLYANLVHNCKSKFKFMQNMDLSDTTKQDRVIQVPYTQF